MSTIKIRWVVDELVNVLTLYDQQKVYRSTTGETGVYSEITGVGTRVVLVADQESYYFDDTSGDANYWYKIRYFHSSTLDESDLSDPIRGDSQGFYITLQDVRDAGVTVTQADDATVLASIELWSQFMDRACGQWFEPRSLDILLDGTDSKLLWFQVPIISVSALYINELTTILDTQYYHVYNNLGAGLRDDRRDPKIALKDEQSVEFFARTVASMSEWKFLFGRKNQRIVGVFGYVESDFSTPLQIQRAVLKLVTRALSASDSLNPDPVPIGPIVSEKTDGHSITYGGISWGKKVGLLGITGDPEVDQIIALYKAPKPMRIVA